MANEDIDYNHVVDTAVEKDKSEDPDQGNKSVLKEVQKELARDIATFRSFDSVELPANAKPEEKIAAFDQIAINKGLALHLEKYKSMINNKLEELG